MSQARIPNPVAVVVSKVLGAHYYNHRRLNNLFVEKGAPGEPPEGNCEDKCIAWLKRTSGDDAIDALSMLGGVLEEFMEADRPPLGTSEKAIQDSRQRVSDQLPSSASATTWAGAYLEQRLVRRRGRLSRFFGPRISRRLTLNSSELSLPLKRILPPQ